LNSPKRQASVIVGRLRKRYPGARVSLKHKNPFQLLIATILSAQCTDIIANKAASGLFKKYKTAEGLSNARLKTLEKEIFSTGFYRAKARNIIAASRKILKDYCGRVPASMEELTTLPGVGRKTANIVLSSAFSKPEGVAVDTHVKRLSGRLGLSREKTPEKIEKDLMIILPKSSWLDFNFILVNHGRDTCKAQKPLCCECALNNICPSNRCRA